MLRIKPYAHLQRPAFISYIETNRMLGVSFDWTVIFLLVCIIACQVILEDLIVCATTEMRVDMIQGDKLYIKVTCARIDILVRCGECNSEHIRL
jgi:hypothetical protein